MSHVNVTLAVVDRNGAIEVIDAVDEWTVGENDEVLPEFLNRLAEESGGDSSVTATGLVTISVSEEAIRKVLYPKNDPIPAAVLDSDKNLT